MPGVRIASIHSKATYLSHRTKAQFNARKKKMLIIFPPVITVIVLSCVILSEKYTNVVDDWNRQTRYFNAESQYKFIEALQVERGISALYIKTPAGGDKEFVRQLLAEKRKLVDKTLVGIDYWEPSTIDAQMIEMSSPLTFRMGLSTYRQRLDDGRVLRDTDVIRWYTERIDEIFFKVMKIFYHQRSTYNTKFWGHVNAMLQSRKGNDDLGVMRDLGAVYYVTGHFDYEEYRMFAQHSGRVNHTQRNVRVIGDEMDALYEDLQSAPGVQTTMDIMAEGQRQMFLNVDLDCTGTSSTLSPSIADQANASINRSIAWFDRVTDYMSTVSYKIDKHLSKGIENLLYDHIRYNIVLAVFVLATVVLIVPLIFFWYGWMQKKIDQQLAETNKANVLLNEMLPKSVADKLQAGHDVPPEMFDDVTVYFSDVVGFTVLSSKSSPMEIVHLLNELYHAMDVVIEQFNVYKVETIGDAYMVASGVPRPNGKAHSAEICTMALAMMRRIGVFHIPHMPHETILMRIGINTGSVAAGIVGTKMPRYCLFGDTVNFASRLEATGMAMRVHLSESCVNHLMSNHTNMFTVVERGKVLIKGKGEHNTYWLLARAGVNFDITLKVADSMVKRATYHYIDENQRSQTDLNHQATEMHPPEPSKATVTAEPRIERPDSATKLWSPTFDHIDETLPKIDRLPGSITSKEDAHDV